MTNYRRSEPRGRQHRLIPHARRHQHDALPASGHDVIQDPSTVDRSGYASRSRCDGSAPPVTARNASNPPTSPGSKTVLTPLLSTSTQYRSGRRQHSSHVEPRNAASRGHRAITAGRSDSGQRTAKCHPGPSTADHPAEEPEQGLFTRHGLVPSSRREALPLGSESIGSTASDAQTRLAARSDPSPVSWPVAISVDWVSAPRGFPRCG